MLLVVVDTIARIVDSTCLASRCAVGTRAGRAAAVGVVVRLVPAVLMPLVAALVGASGELVGAGRLEVRAAAGLFTSFGPETVPGELVADDLCADGPESPGPAVSAHAAPAPARIATPTPRPTAKPPIRPT
ncbi:hypothetical protein MSAR_34840 [Mycolicibacterium sarraceniae]|uniref:Uncharacterized protein n=1 Tax=Mycolicibacterium sarraceniae TaxID=1534348 RepID=A0A7I7SU81_9MYCO|nr:hypothetical protein MSAR_34840 [Mycolicibacterium sarraceniae]